MKDVLELEVIKKQISQYASFSLGKEILFNTYPSYESLRIQKLLTQTKEAMEIVRLHGNLPFGGIYDIVNSNEVFPEVMIFGEPTNNEILVGSKGLLEFEDYQNMIQIYVIRILINTFNRFIQFFTFTT